MYAQERERLSQTRPGATLCSTYDAHAIQGAVLLAVADTPPSGNRVELEASHVVRDGHFSASLLKVWRQVLEQSASRGARAPGVCSTLGSKSGAGGA